jgi:hypothetical protein
VEVKSQCSGVLAAAVSDESSREGRHLDPDIGEVADGVTPRAGALEKIAGGLDVEQVGLRVWGG